VTGDGQLEIPLAHVRGYVVEGESVPEVLRRLADVIQDDWTVLSLDVSYDVGVFESVRVTAFYESVGEVQEILDNGYMGGEVRGEVPECKAEVFSEEALATVAEGTINQEA